MFVRIIPRKRGNKTYYNASLVESVYDKNKKYSVHKVIKNIGAVSYEQAMKLKKAFSKNGLEDNKLKLGFKYDIGNTFLLNKIWDEWGLDKIIDKLSKKTFSCKVSKILKILILNRLLYPCSENFISKWYFEYGTGIKLIEPLSKKDLESRKLYRYISELERIFPKLMRKLFFKLKRKIHKNKIDKVYYDITSTYFEGNTCILAEYGYSRDKRNDKKQVVLSLVTDKYGFPIYAKIFSGNVTDNTTVDFVSKELSKKYKLTNTIIIGDRGMISNKNFENILKNKMNYLMALSRCHIKKKLESKITELNKMKDNEIKIINLEKCYLFVKFSEQLKQEKQKARNQKIEQMQKRLKFLEEKYKKQHKNYSTFEEINLWLGKLNNQLSCKKYYYMDKEKKDQDELEFKINNKIIQEEEKYDGYIVLESSIKKIINQDSLELYKNLIKVENSFKHLKSDLDIRPIYHRNKDTVSGHIYSCILAYFLENYISWKLKKKNNNTKAKIILDKLSALSIVEKKKDNEIICYELTETSKENEKILEYFDINIKEIENFINKIYSKEK